MTARARAATLRPVNGGLAPALRSRRLGGAQARARANAWLAQYWPGSSAGAVSRGRTGFAVEVVDRGALAGLLWVDDQTGALQLRRR